jgi:hypothetical protein
VCRVLRETATTLAGVGKTIRALLTAAHIPHADETGAKVTGARWWLHVAATGTLTSCHLDRSRGRAAIEAFGVLDGFTGILVHDCRASCNTCTECAHGLCGAHLARESIAAGETHPDEHWPAQAAEALSGLNAAARTARDRGRPGGPGVTPSWSGCPAIPAANGPRPATSWNASATGRPTCRASPVTCRRPSPATRPNATYGRPRPG